MSIAPPRRVRRQPVARKTLSPGAAGIRLTPWEFDQADFEEGWYYELIHGVLVVSPIPSLGERDPNEELGHWLRTYRDHHPQGMCLTDTVFEQHVRIGDDRRRADRVIWIGLGFTPTLETEPTIVVEFVSKGKRNEYRDYEEKSEEYMGIDVQEYWIIDRFRRIMTVFHRTGGKVRKRVIKENQTFTTPLLPGFELPLGKLLGRADRWKDKSKE